MALSKRHQARNEKALQDLIRSVPGNDRCADCEARNPGWASWNLGVFICMRCAAIHRKLGTHISKVKSLSMDSWSSDQVGTMKLQGNENSNNFFNPKKVKPEVPIDVDEVDAAMERFIRRKYVSKEFLLGKGLDVYKARVGFTSQPSALGISGESKPRKLSEDRGPPPPPKTGRLFKFGLRSSSSAVGLSRKNQEAAAAMESPPERKSSAAKGSKQRVYGAAINVSDSVKGLEFKMTSLRDMGFLDEDQNLAMLMSQHGDVSRAAEALSTQPSSSNDVPPPPIAATRSPTMPVTQPKPTETIPQRSATLPVSNSQAFNTNAQASQQGQSFEDSFANLNVSQPLYQQPTGYSAGYYQAPTMPNVSQQYTGAGSQSSNPYMTMPASPMHNPFMNTAAQPMPQYQAQPVNQTAPSMNPFFQQMQQPVPQQSYAAQSSYGAQPSWYDSPAPAPVSQPVQTGNMHNPFFSQQASFIQEPASFVATPPAVPVQQMPSPGYAYAGPQQPNPYAAAAPLYPQPTGRLDKNSIMALYNYPQLAPQPAPSSISPIGSPSAVPANLASSQNPQRSFTMPVNMMPATNTRNPFAVNRKPSGAPVASAVAGNGRSSPDAFADLSSRFVR